MEWHAPWARDAFMFSLTLITDLASPWLSIALSRFDDPRFFRAFLTVLLLCPSFPLNHRIGLIFWSSEDHQLLFAGSSFALFSRQFFLSSLLFCVVWPVHHYRKTLTHLSLLPNSTHLLLSSPYHFSNELGALVILSDILFSQQSIVLFLIVHNQWLLSINHFPISSHFQSFQRF